MATYLSSQQINEIYSGFDKAITSPWLQLDPLNSEFKVNFEHSYQLSNNGQIAQVQYSFDDENRLSMNTSPNAPTEYFGDTLNFPAFISDTLYITDFEGNSMFKTRFSINTFIVTHHSLQNGSLMI